MGSRMPQVRLRLQKLETEALCREGENPVYSIVADMLYVLLTVVHVLVCLFLIGVVLLQSGKAADLAGAFGGMGSQTAFGPRGSATLLSKLTTGSAVLFMITSLTLSIVQTRDAGGGSGSSILEKAAQPASSTAKKDSAPAPTPGGAAPAAPAAPQPTVTLMDETTGEKKTIPLNIPPAPASQQQPPAEKPAPAKK